MTRTENLHPLYWECTLPLVTIPNTWAQSSAHTDIPYPVSSLEFVTPDAEYLLQKLETMEISVFTYCPMQLANLKKVECIPDGYKPSTCVKLFLTSDLNISARKLQVEIEVPWKEELSRETVQLWVTENLLFKQRKAGLTVIEVLIVTSPLV